MPAPVRPLTRKPRPTAFTETPRSGWSGCFSRFASWMARVVGSPVAFLLAIFSVALWAVLGPVYHFSDAWQLVINSVSNIVAYVMVFLLQNTQNRDSRAINLKLDELIRAVAGARPDLIEIERLSDQELEQLARQLRRAAAARHAQLHSEADREPASRTPAA